MDRVKHRIIGNAFPDIYIHTHTHTHSLSLSLSPFSFHLFSTFFILSPFLLFLSLSISPSLSISLLSFFIHILKQIFFSIFLFLPLIILIVKSHTNIHKTGILLVVETARGSKGGAKMRVIFPMVCSTFIHIVLLMLIGRENFVLRKRTSA